MSISSDSVAEVVAALESGGFDPRPTADGQWASRCPVHQGSKPNLIISRGHDGRALLHCHHSDGCGFRDILAALNISPARPSTNGISSTNHTMSASPVAKKPKTLHSSADRAIHAARWTCRPKGDADWKPDAVKLVGRWTYYGESGEVLLVVVRFQLRDGSKSYSQVHPVEGGWHVGMPTEPRPLYRLPEVMDADRVYFVEGEKAADAVAELGLVATTTPGGSKAARKANLEPIRGRHVIVLPDNDQPGREYAAKLMDLLTKAGAASVKVVDLPGLPDKGDVCDWLEDIVPDTWSAEQCRAELERLAARSTEPTPDQRVAEARNEIADVSEDAEDDPDLDEVLAVAPRTDLGNAERLVARHRRDIRFCPKWGKWLVWDGRRFAVDEDGAITRKAKATVRKMLAEAATIADGDRRLDHANHGIKSESLDKIRAMIKLAESEPGIAVDHEALDQNGWLLNCPNGTVDLRTGKLRPHRREDLITQLCPVEYHPNAQCPQWLATLDLFFARDKELIAYWQAVTGYFLTGIVRDHLLPIAFGNGSNGKSTMLETQMSIMGVDYSMKAASGFLMSKHHEPHPTEKADLFRKRLLVAIETEEGRRVDEALIKELTGGDRIRARRMREDLWQFIPTHKVCLATNHRPTVRGTDNGIWRRLRLVPFEVTMPDAKADTSMADKLRAEYQGILAWYVQGCLAWQANGLQEPKCVTDATKEYRGEQDIIGSFLDESTLKDATLKVKGLALYEAYKRWAESGSEHLLSQTKFGQTLKQRGFHVTRSNGIWYQGIGLRQSGESTF